MAESVYCNTMLPVCLEFENKETEANKETEIQKLDQVSTTELTAAQRQILFEYIQNTELIEDEREERAKRLQERILSTCDSQEEDEIYKSTMALFHVLHKDEFNFRHSGFYNDTGRPRGDLLTTFVLEDAKVYFNHSSDEKLAMRLSRTDFLHNVLGGQDGEVLRKPRTIVQHRKYLKKYEDETNQDVRKDYFRLKTQFEIAVTALKPDIYRADSTDIRSYIKARNRDELIQVVIHDLIREMKKRSIPIPEEWEIFTQKKYSRQDIGERQALRHASTLSSQANVTEDRQRQTAQLLEIGLAVHEHFSSFEKVQSLKKYEVLGLVIGEQVEEDEQGNLVMRAQSPADSIQSPYDLEARYRKKRDKKWTGYGLCIMEGRDYKKNMGLILSFDLQPNTVADPTHLQNIWASCPRSCLPQDNKPLVLDGGFYGSSSIQFAERENFDLHFTNMTGSRGNPKKLRVSQFQYLESGEIAQCPAGKAPRTSSLRGGANPGEDKAVARFGPEACQGCPLAMRCHGRVNKDGSRTITITQKSRWAAETKDNLDNPEYQKMGRVRAAIEGLISTLKRFYGSNRLKVRGQWRVGWVLGSQCSAYNSSQIVKHIKERVTISNTHK